MLNSGVYIIINRFNGKIYVGSTTSRFNKRWLKHKSELRLNKHCNAKLQRSFNKYGEKYFEFKSISTCPKEYVLKLEQWFIDNLKPEYNICPTAGNSIGVKRTEEYKNNVRKIREAQGCLMTNEGKEKARARMMGNAYTKGKKVPAELIEIRRQSQIGSKRSEATKEKMRISRSKAPPMTQEWKTKMKESGRWVKLNYTIQNVSTQEVFTTNNLRQFCVDNNLHDGHLNSKNKTGKFKKHKGFKILTKESVI